MADDLFKRPTFGRKAKSIAPYAVVGYALAA